MPTRGVPQEPSARPWLGFRLDRSSPVPIYHQLAQQIEQAIKDGRLQPGDLIESEVALARRLELSRPTVRHAIAELTARGLVVRRRRTGTAVASRPVDGHGGGLSLFSELVQLGLEPTTKVLRLAYGEVDERIVGRLNLDPGTPLIATERLRLAAEVPLALLRNWLPATVPDLSVAHLQTTGLYEFLSDHGLVAVMTEQTIGARSPTARERELLAVGRDDPVLTVSQLARNAEGAVLEYGEHTYRADRYRFRVSSPAASSSQDRATR